MRRGCRGGWGGCSGDGTGSRRASRCMRKRSGIDATWEDDEGHRRKDKHAARHILVALEANGRDLHRHARCPAAPVACAHVGGVGGYRAACVACYDVEGTDSLGRYVCLSTHLSSFAPIDSLVGVPRAYLPYGDPSLVWAQCSPRSSLLRLSRIQEHHPPRYSCTAATRCSRTQRHSHCAIFARALGSLIAEGEAGGCGCALARDGAGFA